MWITPEFARRPSRVDASAATTSYKPLPITIRTAYSCLLGVGGSGLRLSWSGRGLRKAKDKVLDGLSFPSSIEGSFFVLILSEEE